MSKIRPYTEKDMKAVHLCAVRDKLWGANLTVTGWTTDKVQLSDVKWHPFWYFLKEFEFLDGSPCGIEEEEK